VFAAIFGLEYLLREPWNSRGIGESGGQFPERHVLQETLDHGHAPQDYRGGPKEGYSVSEGRQDRYRDPDGYEESLFPIYAAFETALLFHLSQAIPPFEDVRLFESWMNHPT
jgi:hypothetical protein